MDLRILQNFFVCIVISVFILFPWNAQKAIGQSLPESTVQAAPVPSENPEPTPVPKSEIEQIKSKGKIVIAMVNKDNAPFFSQNKDGKLVGLDVDLAESIAESLGIKAEFLRNSSTFDGVIENVYRGEADIAISKLARSLPRAQKVLFSSPYLNFRQALLLNRLSLAKSQSTGQTTDQVVKDFQGKIGVYAGSVYVQYASKTFPKATIVEFTNWEDAIDAVVSGQVTALFRDELEVRSIVLKKPELSIKLRTVVLTDTRDTKGIVTASGKRFLLDYTNLFLDTQYKQRDANHILSDYIN